MPQSKSSPAPIETAGSSPTQGEESALYHQVREILEGAKSRVARSINVEMTRAYWLIGEAIVQREQAGKERADYGARLIESLAQRFKQDGVKGFSSQNLWYMRQFHLAYPILHAVRGELSWTHYRLLLKVEKSAAREFYEREAVEGAWSTRELERQISALYYERALLSKEKAEILQSGRESGEKYQPQEFIKDPFLLEFLGLEDAAHLSEHDLESALLDHLQTFLLEMGKGFSFVARQKRITLDGDHFYIDLVFYNRLLRCFVLLDLKMGKLTQGDLGQMLFYTNYYTREINEEHENPAIGILLCADKNDAVVKYTLPENQNQIFAARYALELPSEEELQREIARETQRFQLQQSLEK